MALLPSDAKGQRLLLAGVIPLALLFAYNHFVATPRSEETESLRTQREALVQSNAAARAIAQQGALVSAKLDTLEQQLALLERLVPRTEEVPLLLREISLHARDTRIELTRLKPEAVEAGEHYVRRTYEINVQGPYHAIGVFLTNVGSLSRIMTPIEFKLLSNTGKETHEGSPVLNANFRLLTYVVPEAADSTQSAQSPPN